jgi:hypothetical protein
MPGMIQAANDGVTMEQACRWAEVEIPEGFGNRKTWCPFGHIAHPDGGTEAALRIYEDTNSCYCFACGRAWRPVSLLAEYWDCTRTEAAERMMKMAGITLPDWRDRWAALQYEPPPGTDTLAEALKTWCARMRGPSWEREQFEERFAAPLAACFGVLPAVSDARDAVEWLDGCKLIMEPLLRG